jgi:hypothetical protein
MPFLLNSVSIIFMYHTERIVNDLERQYFNLMIFFEGYVKNYRRLNLTQQHNKSMLTRREIDYFANLGEVLGYDVFMEDSKHDYQRNRSRPMDLAWWKWDSRIDKENYIGLVLHLERENQWNKDTDTIDKLFSKTDEGYIPHNVIGIQNIPSISRIDYLNEIVIKKNKWQGSEVLMVYRFFDQEFNLDRVLAFYFTKSGLIEERKAVCKKDELGYWFMCFEEEFQGIGK